MQLSNRAPLNQLPGGLSFRGQSRRRRDGRMNGPIPKESGETVLPGPRRMSSPRITRSRLLRDFINGASPVIPDARRRYGRCRWMLRSRSVSAAPLEAMKWCVHRYKQAVLMTSESTCPSAWRQPGILGPPPGGVGYRDRPTKSDFHSGPPSAPTATNFTSAKAGSPSRGPARPPTPGSHDENWQDTVNISWSRRAEGKERLGVDPALIGRTLHVIRFRRRAALLQRRRMGRSNPMGDIHPHLFRQTERKKNQCYRRDSTK